MKYLLIGGIHHGTAVYLQPPRSKIEMYQQRFARDSAPQKDEYLIQPYVIDDGVYRIGFHQPTTEQIAEIPQLIVKHNILPCEYIYLTPPPKTVAP